MEVRRGVSTSLQGDFDAAAGGLYEDDEERSLPKDDVSCHDARLYPAAYEDIRCLQDATYNSWASP